MHTANPDFQPEAPTVTRSADWLPLRAKLLTAQRTISAHWFSVFVLAPMIVAGFYFILEPNVMQAGNWFRRAAPQWTGADVAAAGFLLTAALVAAGLPSALRHVLRGSACRRLT